MNRSKPILPIDDENLAHAIAGASIERTANHRHDAIVVGAGAAGGLASALLAEAGMKVLTLDAGVRRPIHKAPVLRATSAIVRLLSHPSATRYLPPALISKGAEVLSAAGRFRQPVQSQASAWARLPEAYVDDLDFPYDATDADMSFRWLRTHLLGGRAALPGRGRQYYRLSPSDFEPADERSPKWPMTYKSLVAWYEFVEKRIGLAGREDGGGAIPDSVITRHIPASANEAALIDAIKQRWPDATAILGRHATARSEMSKAAATGNLLCRTGAIVRTVEMDTRGAARGVVWHDRETGRLERASAPIVFLCASPLESTRILMMSGDGGIGAKSGQLGRYLMDHVMQRAEGVGGGLPGGKDAPEPGRNIYLPQFDQRDGKRATADRGFGVQLRQTPGPRGQSWFTASALGEMAPNRCNRISLDPDHTDALGAPRLRIHCQTGTNETAGAGKRADALRELAELAGVKLSRLDETPVAPGLAAHECGTARMGRKPDQSVLDPYNQCWEAKGLYLTDAAAMVSQGRVGPALTVMALTARACAHALQQSPQETKPKARARARAERTAKTTAPAKVDKPTVKAKRKAAPRKRARLKAEPGHK